jgi:hypothetical protein
MMPARSYSRHGAISHLGAMTDAARTMARPDEAGTVARWRFDEGGGLVGSGRPPCVTLALRPPVTADAHVQ